MKKEKKTEKVEVVEQDVVEFVPESGDLHDAELEYWKEHFVALAPVIRKMKPNCKGGNTAIKNALFNCLVSYEERGSKSRVLLENVGKLQRLVVEEFLPKLSQYQALFERIKPDCEDAAQELEEFVLKFWNIYEVAKAGVIAIEKGQPLPKFEARELFAAEIRQRVINRWAVE